MKTNIYITVTGILKNIPHNSDFPLSVVVPYSALENTDVKKNLNDWVSTYGENYTFIELQPGFPVSKFNAALQTFAKKHKPAEYAQGQLYITAFKRNTF